jgi:hypothetical protein
MVKFRHLHHQQQHILQQSRYLRHLRLLLQ